jgi:hypothetical protein
MLQLYHEVPLILLYQCLVELHFLPLLLLL